MKLLSQNHSSSVLLSAAVLCSLATAAVADPQFQLSKVDCNLNMNWYLGARVHATFPAQDTIRIQRNDFSNYLRASSLRAKSFCETTAPFHTGPGLGKPLSSKIQVVEFVTDDLSVDVSDNLVSDQYTAWVNKPADAYQRQVAQQNELQRIHDRAETQRVLMAARSEEAAKTAALQRAIAAEAAARKQAFLQSKPLQQERLGANVDEFVSLDALRANWRAFASETVGVNVVFRKIVDMNGDTYALFGDADINPLYAKVSNGDIAKFRTPDQRMIIAFRVTATLPAKQVSGGGLVGWVVNNQLQDTILGDFAGMYVCSQNDCSDIFAAAHS